LLLLSNKDLGSPKFKDYKQTKLWDVYRVRYLKNYLSNNNFYINKKMFYLKWKDNDLWSCVKRGLKETKNDVSTV